ncbi:hypothetical protein LJK87_29460 [Paenibacillus sp. P25]|nr:hypothetical protein LJK87_29460 [Paenibacillus sp. P25]
MTCTVLRNGPFMNSFSISANRTGTGKSRNIFIALMIRVLPSTVAKIGVLKSSRKYFNPTKTWSPRIR